jgi:DNA-binding LytR/AlgR family response regulator
MKFTIIKNPDIDDDRLDLHYRQLNSVIHQIINICEGIGSVITGEIDGKTVNIDIHDIFYIEWVDDRSCICTQHDIYTSKSSLVWFEDLLTQNHFVRVSKTFLVNVFKIKSISSGANMKLFAELVNTERIIISRRYRERLIAAIHEISKGIRK